MKPEKLSQEIVIYKSKDGQISFNVNVFEETVWLTQKQMTELFEKDQSVITRHIKNIFAEKELEVKSNMQKMHNAFSDKPILLYSLKQVGACSPDLKFADFKILIQS